MRIDILYYTLYSVSLLGIFVVSALLYLKRREAEFKYFAMFAVLLGVWLLTQLLAQMFSTNALAAITLLRVSTAISPFFAVYFFLFAARYVGKTTRVSLHFVVPMIATVPSIFTNWVVQSATVSYDGIVIEGGVLYYLVFGFVAGYTLVAIASIVREAKGKKLGRARRQANMFLAIAIFQVFAMILGGTIFFPDEPFGQIIIPFSLFLMIIIFGYAIVRHRLFDIRMAAVRALAYSFSLVTLAALYSLLAFGLANVLLGSHDNLPQQLFYLAIALLLALTFAPLKNFFDNVTRSIFYQDAYESQKVIDSLSSALVSTVDIKSLSEHTAEILRSAIKAQYIAIVLPPEDGAENRKGEKRIIVHGHNEVLEGDKLYRLLSRQAGKVIVQDEIIAERSNLLKAMQSANCAVVARLETHNELMGYVLFGAKNNGRPYTSQDIDLIHTTSDELALGIQNALRFEEIRSFNRTLQERIEDATAQLRGKNAQLRKLDATKDEFVSMASHQLRTPLTSVKGYISMVLEGDAGKITKMQRQLLGEAFTSSERMVHLISDFLNVSRLQTGKFLIEARQIDLAQVVGQEVESLQTTAKAHNMKLVYRAPSHFPLLYIDEGKIRQVVMNFIDNAIYYSREHTTITVKAYTEAGDIVVTVHDTGIGVPKAEQAHLFTKFFRASNARKQRPDGTGVGLFLAKKVVMAHGGSMIFESHTGEGSTFGFRLPVKRLADAPANDADKLDK